MANGSAVTMSGVWDRTSEFISDNLATVTAIALPTIYLPGVVQRVLEPVTPTLEPGGRLGVSLLSLALTLVGVFGQAALIALAIDPAQRRDGAFRTAARRFGPMIGVSLVILLGLLLLFVPVLVLMAAGGVDFDQLSNGVAPNLDPASALWITLYVLVLLPVLLWLAARLSVVGSVVVAERRGLGAIGHGFRLTRGLAGRIVGVLILFIVVAGVAWLAAQTVFGTIFRLALGGEGPVTVAGVLTALLATIVSSIATVILCGFVAKLYLAVRDRGAVRDGAAVRDQGVATTEAPGGA